MQLGLVGLGRMGGNMRDRLRAGGHTVVGFDRNPHVSDATSLADMVAQLTDEPRVVWVMVPEQAVAGVVTELRDLLDSGDIVIDGGNSRWTNDAVNAATLAERGVHYLDVGVSGGIWGKENGYALMVGGDAAHVAICQPIFDTLKPAGDFGFVHAGDLGAGHFTKMVHNGIEYAMMQAYAEGWELLKASREVTHVTEAFNSWREGTVIRSWLLDLMCRAINADDNLDQVAGVAQDSGEGRWTVQAGIDLGVATPAISAALYARFVSQSEDSPAMKAVAAMRNEFGGHAVVPGSSTRLEPKPPVQ